MEKDPVCSQDVDEKTEWSSTYKDKIYYFNSAECKADFDKNPADYVSERTHIASRARERAIYMSQDRKDKAVDKIGSISTALRTASQRLREQNQAGMADYTDKAALNVDKIIDYLQQNEAEYIIHEAEDFIRRHPALMIGGAFTAGFLAARFLKSSRAA
jgi:YHS domain-containing protein